ncbi:unnamed protein product [Schistosoma spindalis]|nr:unnamed protein product [Schistosoma spindale]
MKHVRRLVVLAVQLAIIVCTSYQLTKLLFQFKWKEQFGLSRNDDGFSYNVLPRESYSSSARNSNQTYYIASQMTRYENKITLGFTEKDLEKLYEVKSTPSAVDIYGGCGTMTCPREVDAQCFSLLRKHYKFYLSFENSLCPDYITEKIHRNALINNVIPVVMGASYEEYKRVTPPHSFIHVDQFESPEKLANYLKYLDRNDTAYNEYFAWHEHGTIDAWSPLPQCAICLLAHTAHKLKTYTFPNVSKWWNDACVGRKIRWNPIH